MADSPQSLKPLRNHSVDLLLPHLFYVRHNFLLVRTLFSHFFFFFSPSHCSSVALHSDPLILFPVPLLLNSLPGDPPPSRRAICSEAQVQSYQRGTGPCSQRHDLSLRGSWGAILCPSNTEAGLLPVVPALPVGFYKPVSCLLVWSFKPSSAVSVTV